MWELHNMGQLNWCSYVENILHEVQLQAVWEEQNMNNTQYACLKETLHKNFMNQCPNSIDNTEANPKLRTFKLYKEECKFENYLMSTKNLNHTLALFRFRISSQNLKIETGSHTIPKTPINERLCIYCSSQTVENESHFLLECNLYRPQREELYLAINNRHWIF
jgi:hypothetical protein